MKTHFKFTDREFEQQFQACLLSPIIFNHEAHLRLAWIHIQKYGVEKAIDHICHQLFAFVEHVGAQDKYNKTLTIAAIRCVNHFMNKSGTDNFYDFIHQHPRLRNNFRELMACHYQHDIFSLKLARHTYLEPDLLPFT